MKRDFIKLAGVVFIGIIFVCSLTVSTAQSKELKIGIDENTNEANIHSNGNFILVNLANEQIIANFDKNEIITIKNQNGLIYTTHGNKKFNGETFTGAIQLVPINQKTHVSYKNNWYRGKITILPRGQDKLTVINNVDLEDYLLSVIPSEMPHYWHKEALKAQTVAARTYALGYLGRRKEKGYDLESTIEDQVYLGVVSEKKATTKAIKETRGNILVDKNNQPIIALFHSSAGGYTDSIENIWGSKEIKPSVHIQPRPDYDDKSPYFKWDRKINIDQINTLLNNLNIGELKEIIPLRRSISNRITEVKLIGSLDTKTVNGDNFRRMLKLPSAKFNFIFEDNQITFWGRGFGHGLGLSQWGAKILAEKGFNYKQILAHYYPGTRLIMISE